MSAKEQALALALRRCVEQMPESETWPPARVAKQNAEALLAGRMRPEDYLVHARDAREVA